MDLDERLERARLVVEQQRRLCEELRRRVKAVGREQTEALEELRRRAGW